MNSILLSVCSVYSVSQSMSAVFGDRWPQWTTCKCPPIKILLKKYTSIAWKYTCPQMPLSVVLLPFISEAPPPVLSRQLAEGRCDVASLVKPPWVLVLIAGPCLVLLLQLLRGKPATHPFSFHHTLTLKMCILLVNFFVANAGCFAFR